MNQKKKPTNLLKDLKAEKPKRKPRNVFDKKELIKINRELREIERDRFTILREIKTKVNTILEIEKIDPKILKEINKYLNSIKIYLKPNENITAKIKRELKNLSLLKKNNKIDLTELQIRKRILLSQNEIFKKTGSKQKSIALINFYNTIIKNITLYSKNNLKFEIAQRNFQNHVINEIYKQLLNSENINDTLLDIFSKINEYK